MKLLGFREGCYIIRLLGLRVHCYSIRLLVGVQSVLVPHKTVCWVSEYSVSVTAEDYVLGFRVYWYHIRLFIGFQSILLVLQQKTMCWGSECTGTT